jgi:hypothetical protein
VSEVIRLAAACAAERYEQRPPEYPTYRADALDDLLQPMPARDALFGFVRRQPDEVVSGLYAIYRVGDFAHDDTAAAMDRYCDCFELAMQPIHRPHGAADLVAKAPLAEGLRRGMEQLGLSPDTIPSRPGDEPHPVTYQED